MSATDPDREPLEVHLLVTAGLVRRAYNARLAPHALNLTESGMLQFLAREQPMSQTELAERLHIGRMSAGSVVKSLLQRDLLERERDPDDARAWLIRLTRPGEELAAKCVEVNRAVVSVLRADLSRDDQRSLDQLLRAMRTNAVLLAEDEGPG